MDGYVKNISKKWKHAMKRSVGPGGKIPISELYEQYGIKYAIEPGEKFVQWLRNVKLKDSNSWKIVFNEGEESDKKLTVEDKGIRKINMNDNTSPIVPSKLEVADIVGLSVRKAREVIPNITDLTLLKYSLQEANKLAGKDSLCRILRKRVSEIQIAR